jgi:hypothetical protein
MTYQTNNPLRRIALTHEYENVLEQLDERGSARFKHIDAGNSEAQYFRNAGMTQIAFESARRMPEYWELTEDGSQALTDVQEDNAPELSREQADALWEHSDRLSELSGRFRGRDITGKAYTGETTAKMKRLDLIERDGWSNDSLRMYVLTDLAQEALEYLNEYENQ